MDATDSRAKEVIRRAGQMASVRAPWEAQWQEIAELMRPMRADFAGKIAGGQKRTSRIFDGTALMALDAFSAGLSGQITSPANEWFALSHNDDALADDHQVKLWLAFATKRMRTAFAANGGRFYMKVQELYADLAAFGTAPFYLEPMAPGGDIFFSSRHLEECLIAENRWEQVDTLFRRFPMTAKIAIEQFGDAVSPAIRKAAAENPDQEFAFIHAVLPNPDYAPGRELDRVRGRAFASWYVEVETCRVVEAGGYRRFPYQVPRWSTASRGLYGDAPAFLALPDTKMENAMARATIVAAQKAIDPPILAQDERGFRPVNFQPGKVVYSGIDEQGRARYAPLQTDAKLQLGFEIEEQRRNAIREAFYHSLMLMIAQPNQTATEVLARQEEKLKLLGPPLGRIQAEFLDPLIETVFNLLLRAGEFPAMPEPMLRHALAQGRGALDLKIEYVSPLARLQKAAPAAAVDRFLQPLLPLAQLKPETIDLIDVDKVVGVYADAFGVPPEVMRDPREVAKLRKGREAQARMQQLAAAAQPAAQAAQAVESLANAQATRAGAAA